jgi:hypothetical protein
MSDAAAVRPLTAQESTFLRTHEQSSLQRENEALKAELVATNDAMAKLKIVNDKGILQVRLFVRLQ